ncbi:GNAT family N-acetyltransferase [Pseudoxanthomonas putridarboris]|uniref:GNAT family N-acetyltransferase n=1 Tax=Pseudoxanthomonas putridarboris TaxID=752605 RepID=A0ABU9J367_9GAMM
MSLSITRATLDDVDSVASLFDQYRRFYRQPADSALAQAFISERLRRGESAILLAERDGAAAGFTQLFPSFSSVRAGRTWILNDLFVVPDARRTGVARALLQAAAEFARKDGALRLELETDHDNHAAQALYRTMAWEPYDGTLRFRLEL